MQIAELLSDLTSLRACDPGAALALVRPRFPDDSGTLNPSEAKDLSSRMKRLDAYSETEDSDLGRAQDLVRLHYSVKIAHSGGVDDRLKDARERVRGAISGLV